MKNYNHNFIDNVLINLKRQYSKDEVLEAIVAQNTRYEKEIKILNEKIEKLEGEPLSKIQIKSTKELIREIYKSGKRADGIYTFKVPKKIVREINKAIFS